MLKEFPPLKVYQFYLNTGKDVPYEIIVELCQTYRHICLTLSILGKIFSRQHFEILFLFFPENRIRRVMQIASNGNNLHEMSNPVFWGKKRNYH